MNGPAKSLKENYILSVIRTIGSMLFSVATFSYASRVLSVEGIGKVDFARSIVAYFTYIATLGVSTYGIREVAKVRDNKSELSKVVKEIFTVNLISTAVSYLLFFLSLAAVPKFRDYRTLLLINSLSIGFTSLGLDWLYTAIEEFRYIAVRTIAFQVASFAAMFLLVRERSDFYAYALIITMSAVGSNIFNFAHARQYVDIRERRKLEIRRHIKPIFVFFFNSIVGTIYQTMDTSMVGFLSDERAVGLYSASVKMNRLCLSVINVLPLVMMPRVTYYINHNAMSEYGEALKKSVHYLFMLALPMAAILYGMSNEVLILFSDPDFIDAALSCKILASIVVFLPLNYLLSNQALIPFGQEKKALYSAIVGALSDLILNFALIPKYAEVGAAIGTAVACVLMSIVEIIFSKPYIDIRYVFGGLWRYFIAVFFMAAVLSISRNALHGYADYIVSTVAGMAAYCLVLIAVRDPVFYEIMRFAKAFITGFMKRRKS